MRVAENCPTGKTPGFPSTAHHLKTARRADVRAFARRRAGYGKVWQITACDAASSYGLAGLLPAHDAAAAATFLRDVVVPHYHRAGWPVRRV